MEASLLPTLPALLPAGQQPCFPTCLRLQLGRQEGAQAKDLLSTHSSCLPSCGAHPSPSSCQPWSLQPLGRARPPALLPVPSAPLPPSPDSVPHFPLKLCLRDKSEQSTQFLVLQAPLHCAPWRWGGCGGWALTCPCRPSAFLHPTPTYPKGAGRFELQSTSSLHPHSPPTPTPCCLGLLRPISGARIACLWASLGLSSTFGLQSCRSETYPEACIHQG